MCKIHREAGLSFIAGCVLLALVSCSTHVARNYGASGDGILAGTGGNELSAALPEIPLPALWRRASATKYPPKAMGKDYLVDAAYDNCAVAGEAMTFSPDWDGQGLTGAGYCVFAMGVETAAADASLKLDWAGASPADGSCWVGLSDFTAQRWEWHELAGTELAVSGVQKYADADSNVYAAIAVLGTTQLQLTSMTLFSSSSGFILTSTAGVDGGTLPVEYTGDGEGNSPPMDWANVPAGTDEFALMMTTLPGDGTTKWDWVLYHIPAAATGLVKNSAGVGVLGVTTKGTMVYEPPASQGPGPKLYTFTVYALSAAPQLPPDPAQVTGEVLTEAIKSITLATASLSLSYTRQ